MAVRVAAERKHVSRSCLACSPVVPVCDSCDRAVGALSFRKAMAMASACNAAFAASSNTLKPGATPASRGKRCNTFSQKEWIVWIFNPPGVSSAWAKSRLARP